MQELEIGVLLVERCDPAKGAILSIWLDDHVLPSFSERVLPSTPLWHVEVPLCTSQLSGRSARC